MPIRHRMKFHLNEAGRSLLTIVILCFIITLFLYSCRGKKGEKEPTVITTAPLTATIDLASLPREPERVGAIEKIIEEVQKHPRLSQRPSLLLSGFMETFPPGAVVMPRVQDQKVRLRYPLKEDSYLFLRENLKERSRLV